MYWSAFLTGLNEKTQTTGKHYFFKILSNYHKLEQSLRYPRSCTVITRSIDVALVNWKLKRCIFTIFQKLLGISPNWFRRWNHIWAFITVLQWQLTQAIFSSFAASQVWNFNYLDSAYCNVESVLVRISMFQEHPSWRNSRSKCHSIPVNLTQPTAKPSMSILPTHSTAVGTFTIWLMLLGTSHQHFKDLMGVVLSQKCVQKDYTKKRE